MVNLRATVENNLLSIATEATIVKRREHLSNLRNPAKRAVALILHELTTRHPEMMASLAGIHLNRDIDYIASGYRSDVYRESPDMVIKIVRQSIGLSRQQQEIMAIRHAESFAKLKRYIATLTIPQAVSVRPHPKLQATNLTAVVVSQQYREIEDPQLFIGDERHSIREQVEKLYERVPQASSQLGVFLEGSKRLYRDHGLLPDTGGVGNLVVDTQTRGLLLIDGEPISDEHPDVQIQILDHLGQLEAAL